MRTNRYPARQIFRERTMLLHILYLVGITAFANLGAALSEPDTALRLFGKPEVNGQRRMGVALARSA